MKHIVAALLGLFLLTIPVLAHADAISDYGLTEEQRAQLNLEARQLAKRNADEKAKQVAIPDVPPAERISEYAKIGKEFGSGLAATAKELGVAVNDFANTPVGKLTTVLIVWKLIGGQLVHVTAGLIWFIVGIPLWFYFFRRLCVFKGWEAVVGGDSSKWLNRTRFKPVPYDVEEATALLGIRWTMLCVLGIQVIVGFWTIFSW